MLQVAVTGFLGIKNETLALNIAESSFRELAYPRHSPDDSLHAESLGPRIVNDGLARLQLGELELRASAVDQGTAATLAVVQVLAEAGAGILGPACRLVKEESLDGSISNMPVRATQAEVNKATFFHLVRRK